MYNRAHLKQEVKQTISVTRPRPLWVTLLYVLIASIGASLIQTIVGSLAGTSFLTEQISSLLLSGYEPEEILTELLLLYADQILTFVGTLIMAGLLSSLAVTLWQGLMTVGFDGYCLSLVKGEKPTVGRIFCGFPMFGKVILTSLLVWAFTTLWTLLWAVCLVVVLIIAALLMEAVPAVGILLIVLGYVGFMIMVVRVSLRYAMTNFILLDTGKYGLEAVTESKHMMKGKKGKLFMLQLSFIGWYLLILAVTLVGSLITGIIVAVGAAGATSMNAVAGMVAGVTFIFVLMYVAIWVIDTWLQAYVNSSVAKFYLFFRPAVPEEYDSWPTLGDSTTTTSDDTTNLEY